MEENLKDDAIQNEFSQKAIKYSAMILYFNSVAIDVIKRCKELNKKINGIEAFRIRTNGIQPSQTHSIWFERSDKDGFWKEAIEFIKLREDTEFIFEIFYEGYQ